jgi:uncharacterized protein (TIRG00374 family)
MEHMPRTRRFPGIYQIIKWLIAGLALAWLVKSERLRFGPLFSATFSLLHVTGMLVFLMSMLLQTLRWWWVLKIQNIHISFWKSIQLSWIGNFFSQVLPGVAGGEVVRGYYVAREAPHAKFAGISTILADRAMGLYTFLCLGLMALCYLVAREREISDPVFQIGGLVFLFTLAVTLLFFFLLFPKPRQWTLRFIPQRFRTPVETALNTYQTHGWDLLRCFGISLRSGILTMMTFQVAARITASSLTWNQVFLVCPLVLIANSLPITPGGIGVGETAASILFARFGVETGATIMLIVRLWSVILRIPGAVFYVSARRNVPLEQPVTDPDLQKRH